MMFVQVGLTYSKQVRMVIRDKVFYFISFIFKVSAASIPMTESDPPVTSVSIGISCIKVAIRQY